MATRATYQIDGECFYCHWDSYPTGAAHRFANMIAAATQPAPPDDYRAIEDRRGGLAFAFIRGNLDAEPTSGRDRHGDTEYHYELTTNRETGATLIVVRERVWTQSPTWKCTHSGDLADWLNTQHRKRISELTGHHERTLEEAAAEAASDIPLVVRVDVDRRVTYATHKAAETIAANEKARGERYSEDNPNRADCLARAAAWHAAVNAEA